jgi:hypothetical protein
LASLHPAAPTIHPKIGAICPVPAVSYASVTFREFPNNTEKDMKHIFAAVAAMALSLPVMAADPVTPTETPMPVSAATPSAVASTGTVARAQFTSAINDREPADVLTSLNNDQTRIYYFTELKGFEGQKVTHRWEHDGKVMHEQAFEVSSPRYRTYTSKMLDPSWTGEWKASVVDSSGATLSANTFSYRKAEPSAPASPATEPAAPAAPASKP